MLYIRNTSTQICRYIESYKPLFLFFFEIAETISVMLLIWGFAVDFNFFTANPQMFAARNRFANPQTKTLSPQFADLQTGLRKCPALEIRAHNKNRSVLNAFNGTNSIGPSSSSLSSSSAKCLNCNIFNARSVTCLRFFVFLPLP